MNEATIVLPIVHLNGTSAQELIEQRCEMINALHDAGKALARMAPNGRDYYPKPGLMDQAVKQHDRRMKTLKELIEEIDHEVTVLDRQTMRVS